MAGFRQGSTSRPAPASTGARSAPSRPHRRRVHPRTAPGRHRPARRRRRPRRARIHLHNLPPSARSPTACSLAVDGAIAPNWVLGLACGAGGLTGGYLGARLKPRMPETVLRAATGRARDRPGRWHMSSRRCTDGHRGGADGSRAAVGCPPMGGRTTLLSCPPKVRRRTRSRWRSWPRRRWRSGRRPVRRECSRR